MLQRFSNLVISFYVLMKAEIWDKIGTKLPRLGYISLYPVILGGILEFSHLIVVLNLV